MIKTHYISQELKVAEAFEKTMSVSVPFPVKKMVISFLLEGHQQALRENDDFELGMLYCNLVHSPVAGNSPIAKIWSPPSVYTFNPPRNFSSGTQIDFSLRDEDGELKQYIVAKINVVVKVDFYG